MFINAISLVSKTRRKQVYLMSAFDIMKFVMFTYCYPNVSLSMKSS
jgi:hypothetical protein